MKDHEIAAIDRYALMMVRQGKERSRALPKEQYGDPAKFVKFESERIGMKRDIEDTAKADALLMEHYYWQKSYREKLGYGTIAPECRQSRSSRQWDSTAEIVDEAVNHLEMESVDWCMDEATPHCRQAIGKEMRNREAGAKVWQTPSPMTYSEALDMIVPLMRKKDLV